MSRLAVLYRARPKLGPLGIPVPTLGLPPLLGVLVSLPCPPQLFFLPLWNFRVFSLRDSSDEPHFCPGKFGVEVALSTSLPCVTCDNH